MKPFAECTWGAKSTESMRVLQWQVNIVIFLRQGTILNWHQRQKERETQEVQCSCYTYVHTQQCIYQLQVNTTDFNLCFRLIFWPHYNCSGYFPRVLLVKQSQIVWYMLHSLAATSAHTCSRTGGEERFSFLPVTSLVSPSSDSPLVRTRTHAHTHNKHEIFNFQIQHDEIESLFILQGKFRTQQQRQTTHFKTQWEREKEREYEPAVTANGLIRLIVRIWSVKVKHCCSSIFCFVFVGK